MSSAEDDIWPGQLIHQAAIYNNVDLLQCLLQGEEGANINAPDVCGRTALYTAVSNGSLQCLEMLLDFGADMNIPAGSRCHNMTPLHEAVLDSKLDALALLLARGADMSLTDESGKTPMALAKFMKNRDAMAIIELERAKKTDFLEHLSKELCEACAEGKLEDVKKTLDKSGSYRKDVINMMTKGLSPVGIVSRCDHAEILSLLLSEGAAITSQKDTGLTPLHMACEAGNIEVIKVLLKNFPDLISERSIEHQHPLHSAVTCNRVEVVQFLLTYPYIETRQSSFTDPVTSLNYQTGIDVNAQDASGETPLHIACRNDYCEIVQLLIDFVIKVEVDRREMPRSTSVRSVNFVLDPVNIDSDDEDTPEQETKSFMSEETDYDSSPNQPEPPLLRKKKNRISYIPVYPVNANLSNNDWLSPFHMAIRYRHPRALKILLEARGPPPRKMRLKESETSVMMFAYEQRNLEILDLLLKHGMEDDDNKVLTCAFFSQDEEIKWLLLTHKSCRDPSRSINKTEVRKLALQISQAREENADNGVTVEPDHKFRFPSTSVAITWEGIGMLDRMDASCLAKACFLYNPSLNASVDRAISLCAITKVDISKNSFQKFPIILLELPSLVLLKASRNQFAEIPEDYTISSVSLEELHLNENKIKALPKFIFRLPALKYLDVSVNRLKEMPAEMWEQPSLITLNLSNNNLSSLPNVSCEHLWSKQMRSRPSRASLGSFHREAGRSFTGSIGSYDAEVYPLEVNEDKNGFTELSSQDVTNNQVVRVNKWGQGINIVDRDPWKGSSQQSSGLRQLYLNKNKFTDVPSCLPCCAPNLEELTMSENPLSSIGSISDYPSSLVELDLSRTRLSNMNAWKNSGTPPQDITCYGPMNMSTASKYSVSLGNNSPNCLPRNHRRTSSNTSLSHHSSSASRNASSPSLRENIFMPCPHRQHTSLAKLEKLNLSYNPLTSVCFSRDPAKDVNGSDTQSMCSMESEEIQGRLLFPKLSELNLNANQLTSLPPDIGELSGLKILSLRGNGKLRELPPKLGLLKFLWKLDLELCPLDGAIQDFLQNSRFPVKDILGFLQSVLEESTEYNCMNLMLVGFHKIGKTSLLRRLCEKGRAPQKASHWRDRVNKQEGKKQTTLLSTVGIDINELTLEKRTKGKVIFRTWDFGGQREYYATHQYFLSPRSLYLVVWSIIDGERGVESLLQWLINIQARAPGASVIIVGTHLDILKDKATKRNFPEDFEDSMMELIRKMFLSNKEPEKSGLPNILTAINVSCKTGESIQYLVDIIYDHVFELKHPRSKTQFLVKQKIPRKYLLLQDIIRELAKERERDSKEPVLNRTKYTLCVQNKMMEKGVTFRDVEELEQATRFLHENGVLFHYDDLPLRDLFFLDPQWLCDQLAKVITVKEINNFAQRGVMKLSSLEFLFKSNTFQPEHIKLYITNLLSKFEVALQFDEEHLLLPSLLPTETELLEMARRKSDVRIPLRKPSESSVALSGNENGSNPQANTLRSNRSGRRLVEGPPSVLHVGSSVFYTGSQALQEPLTMKTLKETSKIMLLAIKPTSNPIFSCCRLYFMTYFPSGFWPRLITRVLADSSLYPIVKGLFHLPADLVHQSPDVKTLSSRDPEWRCWQTGFELFYLGFEMLRIREVTFSTSSYFCDYSQCKMKCSIDNEWSSLDVINSKILEITFPTDSLKFYVANRDGPPLQNLDTSKPSSTIYREEVPTTKLLVKIVEHVDNLLQDWYPDLGELRFNQDCAGRYLITRVIPCPQCLNKEVLRQRVSHHDQNAWFFLNPDVPDLCMPVVVTDEKQDAQRPRSVSTFVYTSEGVEREELAQRPRTLTEGQAFIYNKSSPDGEAVIFSWMVERCMLDVLEGVDAMCPRHGSISPLYLLGRDGITHQLFLAPDVVFQDQSQDLMLPSSSQLDIGPCLGKGNFGQVHEGFLYHKDNGQPDRVAIKILFKHVHAKMEIKRGFQGFLDQACTAYLTTRQEVSILSQLEHPNIVPLIAMCLQPLSLVLMLAPHGSLEAKLSQLNKQGEHLPLFVVRQIVIQVAKALSYLHSHNIIYRDLKSENVLVWEMPDLEAHPRCSVEVKLADYGISRAVLPTGARGFGGTPPFIAPEILQHAGKGTYTAKVDVYSFGMFLFEVLTCRMPFADVNNPNNLVCQGERPSLTVQEAERCPSYMLDLMSLCWSQDPDDRPTMEGILGIAMSFQFCHLQDVVTLGPEVSIYCGCVVSLPSYMTNLSGTSSSLIGSPSFPESLTSPNAANQQQGMSQVWLSSGFHGNNSLEVLSFNQSRRVDSYRTLCLEGPPVVAMCLCDGLVWCADSCGLIQMFHCENLSLVQQLQLPMSTTNSSSVLSLHPLPNQACVLVVSAEGAIYICDQPLQGPFREENTPIVHKVEKCFCSALVNVGQRSELWLGQSKGAVCVWSTVSKTMEYCVTHGPKVAASSSTCAFLVTLSGATSDCQFLWSYNFPGSVIFMWDTSRRVIVEKLDCSQIVSTVDSPVLAATEHFECGQVSALSAIDRYLYIGTTRGSVLITEALTLDPLCVFQCHTASEFYIKTILPVKPPSEDCGNGLAESGEDEGEKNKYKVKVPAVVTVGKGYTNIMKTFHPTVYSGANSLLDGIRPRTDSVVEVDPYVNHTFLLSWNAGDWEFY